MNAAANLRVVAAEVQQVMPWAEGAVHRAIAIPLDDLDLYLARKDIQRPSYFNVSYRIKIDRRYPDFLQRCRGANFPAWEGLAALVLTVGAAVGQDVKGVLVQRGEPLQAIDVCNFWLLPAEEAAALQTGVGLALQAKFLTTVDVNCPVSLEPYARVRARTPANVDGRDRQTDLSFDSSTSVARRPEAVKEGPDLPADATLQELADAGVYNAVLAQVQQELHGARRRRGWPLYPDPTNSTDRADLTEAVYRAVREKRLGELMGLLRQWIEVDVGGGKMHVELERAGWVKAKAKVRR